MTAGIAAIPAKSKPRYVQHWDTVAVAALPAGWFNVWRDDDGQTVITRTVPCAARAGTPRNRQVLGRSDTAGRGPAR